jgi:hypothetical protein
VFNVPTMEDLGPLENLNALIPWPAFKTHCPHGAGLAACPTLGLLVISNFQTNTLSVFSLPFGISDVDGGLTFLYFLGDSDACAEMQFVFKDGKSMSGWMVFTGPATCRLLLLTDAGHDAVHVIDVVARVHVGYVAAPGTITRPRGVAARDTLVAVSTWKKLDSHQHEVRLFEGSGTSWTVVRVVGGGFGAPGSAHGKLKNPYGLRFTSDGTGLAVADTGNNRVSLFSVDDGSFVRHMATRLMGPLDVEGCGDGWLVVCATSETIEFVGGRRVDRKVCWERDFFYPTALAQVPGLGLIVRGVCSLHVLVTPDTIAMASMSASRVAWMVALARRVCQS